MANERANSAADNIARLQREIKTLEASREANNNAELARNKATLADLERAVTDARRNESEARLSLQEATERYEAKIHQLERDNAIANEMAKVNSKMMDLIHHLAYEIVNKNNFVDIRGCSRTS
jgi:chromosome segregation ATPase